MAVYNQQTPNDPDLADALNLLQKQIFLNLNCHHVATIQEFDALTQRAKATINYTKTYFRPISGATTTETVQVSYPVLVDCPVIVLGGGQGSIQFPITKGDECLALFNDRDIDNWLQGTTTQPVNSGRLHSFADAILLVGVRSLPNVLTSYPTDHVAVKFGTTVIKLYADKASIEVGATMKMEMNATGKLSITNSAVEFVGALSQLFKDIQQGMVSTMLGPQPLQMPTYNADLAQLDTFKE